MGIRIRVADQIPELQSLSQGCFKGGGVIRSVSPNTQPFIYLVLELLLLELFNYICNSNSSL